MLCNSTNIVSQFSRSPYLFIYYTTLHKISREGFTLEDIMCVYINFLILNGLSIMCTDTDYSFRVAEHSVFSLPVLSKCHVIICDVQNYFTVIVHTKTIKPTIKCTKLKTKAARINCSWISTVLLVSNSFLSTKV